MPRRLTGRDHAITWIVAAAMFVMVLAWLDALEDGDVFLGVGIPPVWVALAGAMAPAWRAELDWWDARLAHWPSARFVQHLFLAIVASIAAALVGLLLVALVASVVT